jgi:hypothetical protein
MGADEDIRLASHARHNRPASRIRASSSPQNGLQATPNGHFRNNTPLNGSFPALHNTAQDKLAKYRTNGGPRAGRQQTPSQPQESVLISSDTEADGDDEEDEDSGRENSYTTPRRSRLSPKRGNRVATPQTSSLGFALRARRDPRPFHHLDDSILQSDDYSSNRENGRHTSEQDGSGLDQQQRAFAEGNMFVNSAQAPGLRSTVQYLGTQKNSFLSKNHMNGGHRETSASHASLREFGETLGSGAALPMFDLRDSDSDALHLSGKGLSSSESDDIVIIEASDSASEVAAGKGMRSTMSLPHRSPRLEKRAQAKGQPGMQTNKERLSSHSGLQHSGQHSDANEGARGVPLQADADAIFFVDSNTASVNGAQEEGLHMLPTSTAREAENANEANTNSVQPMTDGNEQAAIEPLMDTNVTLSGAEFPLSFKAVEQAVKDVVTEILNENIYNSKNLLARARALVDSRAISNLSVEIGSLDNGAHSISEQYLHEKSPFAQMLPLQTPSRENEEDNTYDLFNTETIVNTAALRTSTVKVPKIAFKCTALDVPKYYQYARLRDNFLGENVKEILIEPFRDDPVLQDKTEDEVPEFYMLRNDEPSETGRRQWYMEHMGPLLSKLGISWTDILRYLLDLDVDTAGANDDVRKAIEERQAMLQTVASQGDSEEIEKLIEKEIMDRLPACSQRNIHMAALLDNIFFEEAEFSLLSLAKANIPDDSPPVSATSDEHFDSYRSRTCRICFIHDCREHGLIFEDPKEVDELSSSGAANDDGSEDGNEDGPSQTKGKGRQKRKRASLEGTSHRENSSPKGFNYKYMLTRSVAKETSETDGITKPTFKPPEQLRDLGKRHMVIPCNHEGTCEQARCRCFRRGIYCEKMCGCAKSCPRRYPGCKCAKRDSQKPRNGSRLCRNKCKCFELNRECDPDLCGNCGVDEVLDPANKYNDELQKSHCGNCGITKGVPMKTYLTNSPYHGFGVILGEPAKPNDFIMEYKGEILTEQEATRRENVIHPRDTSYFYTADRGKTVHMQCYMAGGLPNSSRACCRRYFSWQQAPFCQS